MCGISGILSLNDQRPERKSLERMIHSLRHRGPDGFGFHVEPKIGLAHARLSIIDLSTGDQPMSNEDGTIWTVFNGEIFNYVELRDALQRAGHVFRTHSDTETIVHAYEEYGDAFVEHLNGQFAIALWDAKRERLLLIRDRLGIRPLYVQRDGARILFGSEIKAIFAESSQPRALDVDGLAQVFTFWSTVGERTTFAGVRSLAPGSMLIFEKGVERTVRYWQWHGSSRQECRAVDFADAAVELRALLEDAIRLQLRADVPVGAYLSGGLDSSIIAGLIRRCTDVPLRTFSVVFDDAEFDESEYQQVMVRHLDTQHTAVRCTHADIAAGFARLIRHAEMPILRTAPVPLMLLSEHVRNEGFKVVLTGEGADEVFGGYDLFKEAQIRRFWARQPNSSSRPQLLSRLYPYLRHSPVGASGFAQSFWSQGLGETASPFYAHAQRWATTRRVQGFLAPEVRSRLTASPEDALRAGIPAELQQWEGLARDQYIEAQTLLFGYLLSSQGDRVAMANSVEGRVPFLDHRVVEFANALPSRYKLRGLNEKAILRKAAEDLLPREIVKRVKQPYRAPDHQAFVRKGELLPWVARVLSAENIASAGYFDPQPVHRLIAKCRAGKAIGFADNMAFVGILSTMLVHEAFIADTAADLEQLVGIA